MSCVDPNHKNPTRHFEVKGNGRLCHFNKFTFKISIIFVAVILIIVAWNGLLSGVRTPIVGGQ